MDEKDKYIPDSESIESFESMLNKTWRCVLQQYQKKAETHSLDFGAGIACFIILKSAQCTQGTQGTNQEIFNCKYCYGARTADTQEGPWDTFVTQAPNRKSFLSKYDPEKNYAICVSVHIKETLVSQIKLFGYNTGEEIALPNVDLADSENEL